MDYIRLAENMINVRLWGDFHRHQEVTKCWRKVNGKQLFRREIQIP